jgi:hypothetical protein
MTNQMVTMELHHCRYCEQDKPASEMRRDSSYTSGFRPQCLDCKRKKEGRAPKKTAPPKTTPQAEKLPPEQRVFPCTRCKRKDIPFKEMTKDRRKFMGVGSVCLPCRREREEELRFARAEAQRMEAKERAARVEPVKVGTGDDWEYCWKCNSKARPGNFRQPPPAVANGYPEGAVLCTNCSSRAGDRVDMIRAERRRLGVRDDATRKELESTARVAALRELALNHEAEYRKLFERYMMALGVEQEKKWISL